MIDLIEAPAVGNAVRIFISPPVGATVWRVLRRTADAFTGASDPGAVVVADLSTDNAILDTAGLVNGTPYFYRDFYLIANAWVDGGASTTITPAATYAGDGVDPQSIVRDRLDLGLKVEVARGALKPASGKIPVVTAPFALVDGVTFPCVSVHLNSDASGDRAIGELLIPDAHLAAGGWQLNEGWESRVVLNVVGTSLNLDERIALRRAIKRVLIANLPIFDAAGLLQIDLSQTDTEDTGPTNAPLYYTVATFSCVAPSFVSSNVDEISSVDVTALDSPAEIPV